MHFKENLKVIKQDTISWAREKNMWDEKELEDLDRWIQDKTSGDGDGFISP